MKHTGNTTREYLKRKMQKICELVIEYILILNVFGNLKLIFCKVLVEVSTWFLDRTLSQLNICIQKFNEQEMVR